MPHVRMQGVSSDLDEIEDILLRASDAPTYGVNAKELILRAARQASSARSIKASPSSGQQQDAGQPCRGELADALVNSLTVHERPLVQYINRSAVPRIARQARPGMTHRWPGHQLYAPVAIHAHARRQH